MVKLIMHNAYVENQYQLFLFLHKMKIGITTVFEFMFGLMNAINIITSFLAF